MTSHSRRLVHNTRERILSTDFQTMQALIDAQVTNTSIAAAGRGLNSVLDGDGVSGVFDGFVVRADQPGVNSVIKISPGLAFKVVVPDDPSTDSRYQRLETEVELEQDLQPFRAANPRWVCVCIKPNLQTVTTSTRDIWEGLLGTFSQADIPKVVASLPDVVVIAGTPGLQPVLPDGIPGVIPLAYVYLDALPETALQQTDFVYCRPLYANVDGARPGKRDGGGLEVAAFGSTNVRVRHVQGRWGSSGGYSVSGSTVLNLLDNRLWEAGQSYADALGNNINRAIAFYAYAPPWPLGFDNDIAGLTREFVNVTAAFGGSGLGFTQGCGIVATYNGPLSGNYLGSTGDIVIADPIWGSGGTATESHYIGTVSYTHAPVQGILPQIVDGSDVRFASALPLQLVLYSETFNFNANLTSFDPTAPSSNGKCYPPFTRTVDVAYLLDIAPNAQGTFSLHDDSDPGNVLPPFQARVPAMPVAADMRERRRFYSATQDLRMSGGESGGADVVFTAYAAGYSDPFLSQT